MLNYCLLAPQEKSINVTKEMFSAKFSLFVSAKFCLLVSGFKLLTRWSTIIQVMAWWKVIIWSIIDPDLRWYAVSVRHKELVNFFATAHYMEHCWHAKSSRLRGWLCFCTNFYAVWCRWSQTFTDSEALWTHIGPTWSRQDPCWANVGPTKFAVRVSSRSNFRKTSHICFVLGRVGGTGH